jgi:hypothetical protein
VLCSAAARAVGIDVNASARLCIERFNDSRTGCFLLPANVQERTVLCCAARRCRSCAWSHRQGHRHPVRAWSAVRQSMSGREWHADATCGPERDCNATLQHCVGSCSPSGNCSVGRREGNEEGRKEGGRRKEETEAAHEQGKRAAAHTDGACQPHTGASDSATPATNRKKSRQTVAKSRYV